MVQKTTVSAISVCLLKESKSSTVNVSGIPTVQCHVNRAHGRDKKMSWRNFHRWRWCRFKKPMHTHALSKIYPAINATTRRQKLRSSEKDENVQVAHSVEKKKHALCYPCASCQRNIKHEANRLPAKTCMAYDKVWYGVSWHEKLNASTYFCDWSSSTNINTLGLEKKKKRFFAVLFALLLEFQTHAAENGVNVKLQKEGEKGAKLTKRLNVAFRSPCRCGEKRFVVTRTPDWLRGRNTR